MIYIIATASYSTDKPCDEAVKRTFESWDSRTCTEGEFDETIGKREGSWKSSGKNHKIDKDGYISRQGENIEEWAVEINTLDELHTIIDKYGPIIINSSTMAINAPNILIYNDYIE